jgi:2-polyprenyl-3-methyl-5-hydroxy-6-metoxy-1,4-benzoquinol methylase
VGNRKNLSFCVKQIQDISGADYDAIVISDVLYLVNYAQQEEILKNCFLKLKAQGCLLIKEVDKKPLWKFIFNLFQELWAVRILKFTKGGKFFFRSRLEYEELLSGLGFKVEVLALDGGFTYPHVAYICKK